MKKRFFGFGPAKKKTSTSSAPNPAGLLQHQVAACLQQGALGRRRGSDRSLSGSVHELAVSGVKDMSSRVSHSHSQSNLSDIPYREPSGAAPTEEGSKAQEKRSGVGGGEIPKDDVCPWDSATETPATSTEVIPQPEGGRKKTGSISVTAGSSSMCEDVYPWELPANQPLSLPEPRPSRKNSAQLDSGSSSSDVSLAITEVSERLRKTCGLQHGPEPEKNVRAPSEERVIARIQTTVRKYSTASIVGLGLSESRRSSVTTKPSGSTRPSVSSAEDFALGTPAQRSFDSSSAATVLLPEKQDRTNKSGDDPCLRTYKKSRKRSSVSVAPLISVSSVVDRTVEDSSPSQTLLEPTPVVVAEESPAVCPSGGGGGSALHTESVVTSWEERADPQSRKVNEICPWEDEESCKVDTPFVKTYATLGYL